MKNYKIKVKYDEPMMADAIFKGETEDQVREDFAAYALARGMKNIEIAEIEEISNEEASAIQQAYEAHTESQGRTIN